jgi:hypothetical protein
VTEETKELLRQQANQLPEPTVLRLVDLLAVALEDMRQGGDPRLPLELAIVKVTRPHADLSRESLAHRVELLESRAHTAPVATPSREAVEARVERPVQASAAPATEPPAEPGPPAPMQSGPDLGLDQVVDAWQRSIVEAVRERSIPVASLLAEATPTELADDTLTLEFPAGADFHRRQVGEPTNIGVLHDALFEVTGRRLTVVLETGDAVAGEDAAEEEPISEDDWISSLKDTFDAREVEPDQ